MSDFHKRKEAERANKKLVFSQKSLDEWKEQERARIREAVKKEVMEQVAADVEKANQNLAKQRQEVLKELEDVRERIQQEIEAQKDTITTDAIDQSFVMTLAIPVRVLREKYGWGSRKRLPEFAEYLVDYYMEFQGNDMSVKDYQKYVYEQTGIGFTMRDEDETQEEADKKFEEWLQTE